MANVLCIIKITYLWYIPVKYVNMKIEPERTHT